jgi:hypothetical protein
MAVGSQGNPGNINGQLTQHALALRDVCNNIRNFQTYVVSLGTTGLQALGFSAADAQAVLTQASYLNTVAGCYYGTVQQGGSGGTGAVQFSFDNELSSLWAAG